MSLSICLVQNVLLYFKCFCLFHIFFSISIASNRIWLIEQMKICIVKFPLNSGMQCRLFTIGSKDLKLTSKTKNTFLSRFQNLSFKFLISLIQFRWTMILTLTYSLQLDKLNSIGNGKVKTFVATFVFNCSFKFTRFMYNDKYALQFVV